MSDQPDARTWRPVGDVTDVAPGTAVHVDVDGHSICVARSSGGDVHALKDECSHGQVLLSDGDVIDGVIECWLHGSCFDLTSGVPTGPPATVSVPVYPVRVVDSTIEIGLPPTS